MRIAVRRSVFIMSSCSHIIHPIPPLWRKDSETLILGSFPSVRSREEMFFYGHKQNRFWKVISALFDAPLPTTIEEKTRLITENKLALWDVVGECDISGSADSSIKNIVPNDISFIISGSNIDRVFVNGGTAARLYDRYLLKQTGITAVRLPSTSPANAAWSVEMLCNEWRQIVRDCQ